MDFAEANKWYNGYRFDKTGHVYSPNSIIEAMINKNSVITGHRRKLMNP